MKNNRLTRPFNDYYAEQCRKDPEMEGRVAVIREELRIQQILHDARKVAGLTQQEVAERMHTNRSFVSRLETQPQNVKLDTLIKYTRALGKNIRLEVA